MANNYLLESSSKTSLDYCINKIINDEKFNNININYYDIEEDKLEIALDDLDTYGLFDTKKIIIINNIDKLNIDANKHIYKRFIKYLDNYSEDNLLIITTKKVLNNKKVFKDLKNRIKYLKCDINIREFIKGQLKDYKYDSFVINKLYEYCDNDLDKIYNECNKLKSYKDNDKVISIDDIDKLVIRKNRDISELSFEFTKYVFNKDKYNALLCFKELEDNNVESISLIGLIASQIRIIYQVKVLVNRNLKNEEIADILNEKVYRIKKTRELINYFSEKELLSLIRELADMDLNIKSSDVDPKLLIELFVINLKD